MFCVYLTVYLGDVLPPFYIGSTSLGRLNAGYRGSVKSKKYGMAWKEELLTNSQLFSTHVISEHQTRIEALQEELRFQIELDVVKSSLFINQSLASPNGFFGRDTSGSNHPRFGKAHSLSSRLKITKNHADASGPKNGRASWFRFTSPSGEATKVFGGFRKFCIEKNLPYGTMNYVLAGRVFTRGPCVGWTCKRL